MTHEIMSVTHDMREEPLVTNPREEYLGLRESLDT